MTQKIFFAKNIYGYKKVAFFADLKFVDADFQKSLKQKKTGKM
jgi:hypothetical protein